MAWTSREAPRRVVCLSYCKLMGWSVLMTVFSTAFALSPRDWRPRHRQRTKAPTSTWRLETGTTLKSRHCFALLLFPFVLSTSFLLYSQILRWNL
ncbi:uncharacterized protein BDV17DRAFT_143132 [Aspergillus undulatus]|uniref:uncharacterized protein n=1 Tax=Aspergillus undulatus TaxID=1810928 RepID=UPI003CCD31E2